MRKPIWWAAGAVIVISAVVLFFSWRAHRAAQPSQTAGAITATEPAVPAIRNPLPESTTAASPLPALDESDAPFHDALGDVMGKPAVDRIFRPELLVRHLVVSIDNLSRRHLAVELRPTKPLAGAFIATGNDQQGTIDTANFQRYVPYVQAVQALDMKRLAALYVHFYPLFQQAYQSLGYPNGYFNDRLVVTIDNLLAAPDIITDIAAGAAQRDVPVRRSEARRPLGRPEADAAHGPGERRHHQGQAARAARPGGRPGA